MLFLVSPVAPCDLAGAIDRARRAVGLKHETLAHLMGIASHQLSDQLAGRGHVSLRRLIQVARDADGRQFWIAFLAELAALTETETDDPVALLRRALVQLTKPSMLKATQGDTQNTERRIA